MLIQDLDLSLGLDVLPLHLEGEDNAVHLHGVRSSIIEGEGTGRVELRLAEHLPLQPVQMLLASSPSQRRRGPPNNPTPQHHVRGDVGGRKGKIQHH